MQETKDSDCGSEVVLQDQLFPSQPAQLCCPDTLNSTPKRTWSPSHFWIYWSILGPFQPGQRDSNGTALVMREKSPWEDSGGYLQMTKSLSCEIISGRFGGVWRCAKITYVWVSQLIRAACQHLHRYLIWENSQIPAQMPPFPPSWIS